MADVPTLQSAETDGNGPMKRRRRPALSCVECRMRKVKCDREKPCGACLKVKSATCTYRPPRAGIRSHSESFTNSGAAHSAAGSNEYENEHTGGISPRSTSPQQDPLPPSKEFDLLINRYVAPGLMGEHGRPKLQPLPANRPSLSLSATAGNDAGQVAVIERLMERISVLEGRLAHEGGNTTRQQSQSTEPPGTFVKQKYYGQSHWMNAFDPYEDLHPTAQEESQVRKEIDKTTELYATVADIKRMARVIKATRVYQPTISDEVYESIPSKEICDQLVDGYFRTFEGIFRILHIPTFRKEYEEYWAVTETPRKVSVTLKILLVCATGVPFYSGPEQVQLRSAAAKWIQSAAEWLAAPHIKSRLNMTGLQIHLLSLLARQLCNIDGDHIWILSGSLLRTAMHLGLHRDPSHYSKISTFHCEMRRRLWASVLEMTAQCSLDIGMPSTISANDYDTKPPSNLNDEDIGESKTSTVEPAPATTFTDSSMQIALTQTLPVRLEIINLINNLRFDLSYAEVLRLGKELTSTCRSNTTFFKTALAGGSPITAFQVKMSDTLVRRFVLCLHRPYFVKASTDPQYHYSRKMCLDTSLAIYAPAAELAPGEVDDWTRLSYRCVGFYKSFFLYAMSTVYYELISQLNERADDATLFAPLVPMSSSTASTASTASPATSSSRLPTLPTQFTMLRDIIEGARQTAIARLQNGETNAKAVVFLSCAIARIDALVSGADADRAVLEAAKRSTRESGRILLDVYRAETGSDIDLGMGPAQGQTSSINAQHGWGLGEADMSAMPLPDMSAGELQGQGLPTFNLDATGLDGPVVTEVFDGMDLDLSAYLQGESMEGMTGYHFGRSPEWFYDVAGWGGIPGSGGGNGSTNRGQGNAGWGYQQ